VYLYASLNQLVPKLRIVLLGDEFDSLLHITNLLNHEGEGILRVTHLGLNPDHLRPEILARADLQGAVQVVDGQSVALFNEFS
jgi:hypothetical protein